MRILVVEDEERLARLIRQGLVEEGHAVDLAATGEEALDWTSIATFDVIVLDIMLPGISGLAVCQRLRANRTFIPILLLTARDAIADRVAGLDAGADDYLVKPFALAELTARLRALGRRHPDADPPILSWANIRLDPATRQVWKDDEPIPVPNKEFRILECLLRHPGRVLTRSMIADHVWDYDFPNMTNVIDVHIGQLRRKLDAADEPSIIQTVRGAGYRLGPIR